MSNYSICYMILIEQKKTSNIQHNLKKANFLSERYLMDYLTGRTTVHKERHSHARWDRYEKRWPRLIRYPTGLPVYAVPPGE
jgi:hypothetical protein